MRLGRGRIVTLTVWAVLAFLCGGYEAMSHFHYVADPPPDACGLVPADLLDAFVPGHGTGQAGGGRDADMDAQVRHCAWEPSGYFLAVTVSHVGSGRHGGPVQTAHEFYSRTFLVPSELTRSDLGDESAYQLLEGTVYYSARAGAMVAQVVYSGGPPERAHQILAAVLDRL